MLDSGMPVASLAVASAASLNGAWTALSRVASCSSLRLWTLRFFGMEPSEKRDMRLQAGGWRVFPLDSTHPLKPRSQTACYLNPPCTK